MNDWITKKIINEKNHKWKYNDCRKNGSIQAQEQNNESEWDPTLSRHVFIAHLHCVQKKTLTRVFDYNSGVSLSIYTVFVPAERGMNSL